LIKFLVKSQNKRWNDALPFLNAHSIIGERFLKLTFSLNRLKIILHLKSDGEVLKIPVILHSADNFIEMVSFEQLIFGVFFVFWQLALIYFFFLWLCATLSFILCSVCYFCRALAIRPGWFSMSL
jgi:hypothetical protein